MVVLIGDFTINVALEFIKSDAFAVATYCNDTDVGFTKSIL